MINVFSFGDMIMNEKNIVREINHDIWRKSNWVYVKLQTLLEDFINKFLFSCYCHFDGIMLKEKIGIVADRISNVDFKNFYTLNRYANDIKHNNSDIPFDSSFLKAYINDFNDLVYKAMPDLTEFYLDDSFFKPTIKIQNYSKSQRNVKETKTTIDKNDLCVINCGVGQQDNGFKIRLNKKEENLSEFEKSVYTIIFNFLQRSSQVHKSKFVLEKEKEKGVIFDFAKVYRYQMLLLFALLNGYSNEGKLEIHSKEKDIEIIELAFEDIKNYAKKISYLCQKDFPTITISFNDVSPTISVEEKADLYVENLNEKGHKRYFLYANNLIYKVENLTQEEILKDFLFEFFGYTKFRPGQLEAIKEILNSEKCSVCVMPTGAGKSIVYYMNALLSPCPTIIISPTKILAKDQKRNLSELHGIDDCAIYLEDGNPKLLLDHKFIYMTPEDLQSYELVLKIIHYNSSLMISNVVLDEVHTLCNWSHDFRPDYLMLCNNLFAFLDHCKFLGFTATANHKILSDIVQQLKITNSDVIQPINFNAGNFSFEYIPCKTEEQRLVSLIETINKFISSRENEDDKMIVFTRNNREAKALSGELFKLENYDTSCFDAEHTYSYQDFITGRKHVLIADGEMGIGINLPSVVSIVHYGLPNSKAQYVQEIGRANRTLNSGKSTVIFIDNSNLTKPETKLINFETSIDEIINIINITNSELSSLFRSTIGSSESYNASAKGVCALYNSLKSTDNFMVIEIPKQNEGDKLRVQKYLYKLHLLGIVENWYVKFEDQSMICIQIEVEFTKEILEKIKDRVISYLNQMGNFGKFIYEISNADRIEDVIYIFEKWFYDEFLRYHREQLMNVIEFFNYYSSNTNKNDILKELSSYFSATLQTLEDEKKYIDKISHEELLSSPEMINGKMSSAAEELLSSSYNVKLDLICYLYQFQRNSDDSTNRFLRIVDNASNIERRSLLEHLYKFYSNCNDDEKLRLINKFSEYYSVRDVVNILYTRLPLDIVYYGFLAKEANAKMEE